MTAEQIAANSALPVAEAEERLTRARRVVLAARETRVRPGLDDKVLAGWNGLMLSAFAEAARVLDRDDYRRIAERCADFLLAQMRTLEGRMRRSWSRGGTPLAGYLEDHAAVAAGLIELYQTTFEPRWFEAAHELAETILAHFADPAGGFFDTSDDHESLLLRPKTTQDGALPSGGAMAAEMLIKLSEYTVDESYAQAASAALAQVQRMMARVPLGFAHWLGALDLVLGPSQALAIVGEPGKEALLSVVREKWRPGLVVAAAEVAGGVALLEGRDAQGGRATAYLCREFACERPVVDAAELTESLDPSSSPSSTSWSKTISAKSCS